MVDFSNSVFEGKLESSVPLLNPVDDRSGETFAGALSSGIEGFNRLAFNPDAKKAQADSAKNSLFAEYAEEVSLLADARDQGRSMDEVKRNLRVAQNRFLSNNPELTDEFFTFSNKLMVENGLGGNIYKETPEESGQRKLIENGTVEGWDMTNPQSVAAYKRQLNTKIYITQLEDEAKAIEAEGGVLTAQFKSKALGGLHQLVANGTQWAMDRINAANQKLQGVTDPVMRQSIVDELKQEIGAQTAVIGQTRSQTGNAIDTSYMTSGIETMVKNFEDVATGKTTLAAITNENDTIMAKNQALILMNNPKLAAAIALNKLAPFELPKMIGELDDLMLAAYGGLFSPTSFDESGKRTGAKPPDLNQPVEEVAKVLNLAKSNVHEIMKAGNADPEATASASGMIVKIMESAQFYGASDNDPRNFTATVDFFSDPTVGRFIEQNGASIYPQIAAGAKQIIEQQYGEVVTGLINDRYSTAGEAILSGIGSTVDVTDVSDVMEPIWNGVGIEMVAKEQFKADFRVNQLVDDLNRGPNGIVAPLNKLIRMSAHLSGSTDYEKVYNETYKPRLWQTGTEKAKPTMGQMTGKDLTTDRPKTTLQSPIDTDNPLNLKLEDFSDEELQNAIKSSNAKDPEGMMTADNPLAIAKSYLGKTENSREDVKTIAAFIKNSTGTDINPATTAWCAAFVDAVLSSSGGKGTGKLNARSYLSWGVEVDEPKVGDVVVLQRGSGGKNDWRGHVGFYMGTNDDGTIKVLGGNQSDSVSEDDYDANKVLGFRRAG